MLKAEISGCRRAPPCIKQKPYIYVSHSWIIVQSDYIIPSSWCQLSYSICLYISFVQHRLVRGALYKRSSSSSNKSCMNASDFGQFSSLWLKHPKWPTQIMGDIITKLAEYAGLHHHPKQSDIAIQHTRWRLFCFYILLFNSFMSFEAKIYNINMYLFL